MIGYKDKIICEYFMGCVKERVLVCSLVDFMGKLFWYEIEVFLFIYYVKLVFRILMI